MFRFCFLVTAVCFGALFSHPSAIAQTRSDTSWDAEGMLHQLKVFSDSLNDRSLDYTEAEIITQSLSVIQTYIPNFEKRTQRTVARTNDVLADLAGEVLALDPRVSAPLLLGASYKALLDFRSKVVVDSQIDKKLVLMIEMCILVVIKFICDKSVKQKNWSIAAMISAVLGTAVYLVDPGIMLAGLGFVAESTGKNIALATLGVAFLVSLLTYSSDAERIMIGRYTINGLVDELKSIYEVRFAASQPLLRAQQADWCAASMLINDIYKTKNP